MFHRLAIPARCAWRVTVRIERVPWRVALLLAALVSFVTFRPAAAGTIEITTDMVIDAGNSFPDDMLIVREGDDGPTTLTVVDGGLLGEGLQILESSRLEMTGGTIMSERRGGGVLIQENSSASVSGGLITGGPMGVHNASATISGDAVIESFLLVGMMGDVTITGGQIRGPGAAESGTVTITGGIFSETISALDTSSIDISGGDFLSSRTEPLHFHIRDTATLHVRGFDLEIREGMLTGTLADGNPLNNPIDLFDNANVVLWQVPEPSSMLLAVVGAAWALFSLRFHVGRAARSSNEQTDRK